MAVAAVVAAASAAALAAATAVVAAAEQLIQASLQRDPPKGFPFFGMPPTMLASLSILLHAESQVCFLPLPHVHALVCTHLVMLP